MQERIGIAGSGVIACGLAATAARTGEVLLWARSDASAKRAEEAVQKHCAKEGEEGLVAERVRVVTDLAELSEATFLVEAVVEDPDHKTTLLSELTEHVDGDAVLATTTSSLSIGELGRAIRHPDRFVGLHVFNPVPRMKLVELVFPEAVTGSVRERARAVCEALGKIAVEVPDIPGFVVNRLLFPYLFSAVELMAQTGLAPEAIDECMTLGAGLPMGPHALLDFVGLDVAAAIGESIGVAVPERVRSLVAAGELGRKSGRGFFEYG